jgi:2-C-methyl-D-erythritol 4-phosphate cytidylyltransferase/2-C-methyl-D-erythritol 2,4-cyclodiphosphate synthase
MSVALIIPAAGSGERLGAHLPKALVQVAGVSLLELAMQRIAPIADAVVVTYPHGFLKEYEAIVGDRAILIEGGSTRHQSVTNALAALSDLSQQLFNGVEFDYVLIHDAARALTPTSVAQNIVDELSSGEIAVIPTTPVIDTIKKIDKKGYVVKTPKRSRLVIAQTPQGFHLPALRRAHEMAKAAGKDVTDDAGLMEWAGHKVKVIEGDLLAFKITYPQDIDQASRLLSNNSQFAIGGVTTGIGTDTHAFSTDSSRQLWLGGLLWEGEIGLEGHSDADVAIHAACDALFAAARIGDLGSNFGTSSPEYAGASGERLAKECMQRVHAAGFKALNISLQIIGNSPKIGPRRNEIASKLESLFGCPVSVTATTTDGLGFTGEGKGLSAISIATLMH